MTCWANRHTFLGSGSTTGSAMFNPRCECGAVTQRDAVAILQAEIEELRRQIEELRRQIAVAEGVEDNLVADIERLRAALEGETGGAALSSGR